jgi:hypothetical protein
MEFRKIYSTLFDAHIRLIFSRQYYINCRSTQKHVQFHTCIYFRYLAVCITLIAKSICIYFRFLAVCITLIAKPTCIYFRYFAVCITLIAKKMSTLLHLAGYFLTYPEEILFSQRKDCLHKSNLQDCQTKDHQ